jgi:hypothetical protein
LAAQSHFLKAAERVLETMFFESLCGEPVEQAPPPRASMARVAFRGSQMGWLEVALDLDSVGDLAANFLGLDEAPTPAETASTLAELANMFCGAFLSLHDPRGSFEIGSPHVTTECGADYAPATGILSRWHRMPIGAGSVYWRLFWDDVC